MVERATFASPFIDELVINMYRHLYRHQRARLARTRTPIDFLRLDRETVDALGAGDWLRARRALEFHLIDAAISFLADADVTHFPSMLVAVARANGIVVETGEDGCVPVPASIAGRRRARRCRRCARRTCVYEPGAPQGVIDDERPRRDRGRRRPPTPSALRGRTCRYASASRARRPARQGCRSSSRRSRRAGASKPTSTSATRRRSTASVARSRCSTASGSSAYVVVTEGLVLLHPARSAAQGLQPQRDRGGAVRERTQRPRRPGARRSSRPRSTVARRTAARASSASVSLPGNRWSPALTERPLGVDPIHAIRHTARR